jgi:hypothetical protein
VAGGALATVALAGPWILPLADERSMVERELYELREDYAEQLGWPELAAEVAGAVRALPAAERERTAVLARNYGEAGAVERFGGLDGVPVVSPHVSRRYWVDDDDLRARTLVVVGYSPPRLARHCTSLDRVGTVINDAGVPNEEAGGPVLRCTLPGTFADLWSELLSRR